MSSSSCIVWHRWLRVADFAVGGQNPAALVSVATVNADGDSKADLAVGSGPARRAG
jgi:hypothetical protein